METQGTRWLTVAVVGRETSWDEVSGALEALDSHTERVGKVVSTLDQAGEYATRWAMARKRGRIGILPPLVRGRLRTPRLSGDQAYRVSLLGGLVDVCLIVGALEWEEMKELRRIKSSVRVCIIQKGGHICGLDDGLLQVGEAGGSGMARRGQAKSIEGRVLELAGSGAV